MTGPVCLTRILLAVAAALVLAGTAAAQDADQPLPPEVAFTPSSLAPEADVLPPGASTLPPVDHPRIDKALAYYLGPGRAWVEASLERARPYRDFIRQRLQDEGMPEELFWLAAVESGFDPRATSRAGAAGMWQFMRNSVGGYNMHINPYVDERRDWWKSTDGALKKLKDNYRRLGDWYLALAAYNAGLGRIEGILRRAKGDRDYWSLLDKGLLPRETAGYIPQLLALARISAGWDKYGFTVDWDPSPTWARVKVDRMVDLRLLAEAAGVPADELRAANGELVYHLTPVLPDGYDLKVHPEWVYPLNQALADPALKLIKYYLYTVQKGDTLSQIAQWYGVSTAMIERDNPGLRPSLLKIGQSLVIAALKDVGPYRGASRG
jgi:membrane-bound lytic murein transglycosylase D